jgi:hypothetical protein
MSLLLMVSTGKMMTGKELSIYGAQQIIEGRSARAMMAHPLCIHSSIHVYCDMMNDE